MDASNGWLIGFALAVLISVLGGWLAKHRMKRKLEEGLGRQVKDEEITSISAWMKADDRVVDEVIHDHSPQRHVENAMEDAVSNYRNNE